jgi:tetratricopeptide (TPR) repeat protein
MSTNDKENKESLLNNKETHNTKEDKNLQVGDVITNTEVFIEKNKKIISIVAIAIVVVVAGILAYKYLYLEPKEKSAQNEIYAAQQYFAIEDYQKALNGDGKHLGFIAISDEYSSTKAGKLADFYVGRIYLEQGKYQNAIDYLKKFSPKDAYMSSQVKALIGDAYCELGNTDEAIKFYNESADINPNDFTTGATLMKLGQVYEMKGDNQKALDTYKRIKKDFPQSYEFREIEKYISRMETLLNK